MRAAKSPVGDSGAGQAGPPAIRKTVTLPAPMLALQISQFRTDGKPIHTAHPGEQIGGSGVHYGADERTRQREYAAWATGAGR